VTIDLHVEGLIAIFNWKSKDQNILIVPRKRKSIICWLIDQIVTYSLAVRKIIWLIASVAVLGRRLFLKRVYQKTSFSSALFSNTFLCLILAIIPFLSGKKPPLPHPEQRGCRCKNNLSLRHQYTLKKILLNETQTITTSTTSATTTRQQQQQRQRQ